MSAEIRQAADEDWPRIWPIWREVVTAGETYAWPPDTSEAAARQYWMLPAPAEVWVAEEGDRVVGTALLKPNHPGLGNHVANASYMVSPEAAGQGIGRRLAEAILGRAAEAGYKAMQFNAVVATNERAVALWRSLGFEVIGRSPDAFRLPNGSTTDLLIMHRRL